MHEKYSYITKQLANKLAVSTTEINNAILLIEDNYALPFIARYRKTETGGLLTKNLRSIEKVVLDLRDLESRRTEILNCIRTQNKLTESLQNLIEAAKSKQALEDLYLPYRAQRMTKAISAKQRGLEPLAKELLTSKNIVANELAAKYVDAQQGVVNAQMALEGARQIIMEDFAEDPHLLKTVREYFWQHAFVHSTSSKARKEKPKKYSEYWDFIEEVKKVSEHQLVAIFTGRTENYLKLSLTLPDGLDYGAKKIIDYFNIDADVLAASSWLRKAVSDTWLLKLFPKVEVETLNKLRSIAGASLIKSSVNHLRQLLFMPPAGQKVTMGLLPNSKAAVALAVVSSNGELLDSCMINPVGMQGDWYQSLAFMAKLIIKHKISMISIANTPGFRDIERLAREIMHTYPDIDLACNKLDSYGLLEYADSETAKDELPELKSAMRAAVSLARRNQDHLTEIAKIEPNTLLIAQYDFCKGKLAHAFQQALQDCVCAIGANLNTASWQVLRYIPGLNSELAKQIVAYRATKGDFTDVAQLAELCTDVQYQQAEGFLYVTKSSSHLDVRGSLQLPKFNPQINLLRDLQQGLELEGVVSKITNYGIFVDIGVYQDGLIHNSVLPDKLGTSLKLGKIVKVVVTEINKAKKRFGLALQNHASEPKARSKNVNGRPDKQKVVKQQVTHSKTLFNTAMADALANLRKGD